MACLVDDAAPITVGIFDVATVGLSPGELLLSTSVVAASLRSLELKMKDRRVWMPSEVGISAMPLSEL